MRSTDDWLVTDELAKLPTQLVYKLLQFYITKLHKGNEEHEILVIQFIPNLTKTSIHW